MEENALWNKALFSENIYYDGQSLWFTEIDYNALFRVKNDSQKVELMGIFPDEYFLKKNLYRSMVMCGGRLYFAPCAADAIAVYHPETNMFYKISIPDPRKDNHKPWKQAKFSRVAAIDKKLYFIPGLYPGILCYDSESKAISCFDGWVDEIEKIRTREWDYFLCFEVIGSQIILPCFCADAVVIFDTILHTSKVIHTLKSGYLRKFVGVCYENNNFYLLSADGTISKRKLNSEEEDVESFQLPRSGSLVGEFFPMWYMEGFLYLVPFEGDKGFKMDIVTGQITSAEIFEREKWLRGCQISSFIKPSVGKLYIMLESRPCLIEFDFFKKYKKESVLLPEKQDWDFLVDIMRREFINRLCEETVFENENYYLEYLLDALQVKDGADKKKASDEYADIGKYIYRTLILE